MKTITKTEEEKLSSIHDQLCSLRDKMKTRRKLLNISTEYMDDPICGVAKAIETVNDTLVTFCG